MFRARSYRLRTLFEIDAATVIDRMLATAWGGNDSVTPSFDPAAPALPLWLDGRSGDDTLTGGPGAISNEAPDHAEKSLMGPPPFAAAEGESQSSDAVRFRGITISRFRHTSRWYGHLVR